MTRFPSRDCVRQNLLDAGCDKATTEQILGELDDAQVGQCLRRLSRHRRRLLEQVHLWERKIDCLDYLVYELEHL